MKRVSAILLSLTLILLIIPNVIFASDAPTVPSSCGESMQYGISLNITFSDGNTSLDAFQQTAFTLETSDGRYILARYSEEDLCYTVTGYSSDPDIVTWLYAGKDPSDPGKIVINGLPNGDYLLTNTQTIPGYTILKDSVELCFENNTALINGKTLESYDGFHAHLNIVLGRGFLFPGTCAYCSMAFYIRNTGIFGFVGYHIIPLLTSVFAVYVLRKHVKNKWGKICVTIAAILPAITMILYWLVKFKYDFLVINLHTILKLFNLPIISLYISLFTVLYEKWIHKWIEK